MKDMAYIAGSDRFYDVLNLDAALPTGWTLGKQFRYRTDLHTPGYITVPKDFPTDLASIPRALRWLVTKDGPSRYAAVVHDYLYSLKGKGPMGVSRKRADKIFKEAMKDMHVPRWKMALMYRGVRAAGWIAFNKK